MRRLTRRALLRGLAGAAIAGTGAAAYAFGVEPRWRLRIQPYALSLPGWPRGFEMRICALADIHASEPVMPAARIERIVDTANALEPDLVVLLGDYIAGRYMISRRLPGAEWSAPLRRLRAPLGVHAILGNHDWWDDREAQRRRTGPIEARRILEDAGVPVLENSVVRLAKGGRPFWLMGLADQYALAPLGRGRHPRGLARYIGLDDLPGTMKKLTDDAPAILLAHEPDVFPFVPDRVALTLSGHTHGGQVRLLGWSPIVPSRYGSRYAYGHIVEGGRHLVVSGGLGTSILPVRFGVPPEIVVVDLG